jgi:solute carrier family 6 GABA transporter-like protein 1
LPFIAFAECFGIGYVYRWNDVYRQVGPLSHWISIVGYIGSVTIAFFVSYALDQDVLAAIIGFVVFIGSIFLATVVARTPDVNPYGSSTFMNKFYWVAMYQVDQMRKDLNVSVAEDGKMEIPFFWGFIMKYITGPVCLILASFSLKDIETVNEFIVIFGFALGLMVVVFTLLGVASPSVFEIFLPRGEKEFCHSVQSVPGELLPLKDDDDEEKK